MSNIQNNPKWFSGYDFIEEVPEHSYILPKLNNYRVIEPEGFLFNRLAKWKIFDEPISIIATIPIEKELKILRAKTYAHCTVAGGSWFIENKSKDGLERFIPSKYSRTRVLLDTPDNIKLLENYINSCNEYYIILKKLESDKLEIKNSFEEFRLNNLK